MPARVSGAIIGSDEASRPPARPAPHRHRRRHPDLHGRHANRLGDPHLACRRRSVASRADAAATASSLQHPRLLGARAFAHCFARRSHCSRMEWTICFGFHHQQPDRSGSQGDRRSRSTDRRCACRRIHSGPAAAELGLVGELDRPDSSRSFALAVAAFFVRAPIRDARILLCAWHSDPSRSRGRAT